MQLGAATWVDGKVASRAIVDDRVCDCCQTATAMTTKGAVIVYRDRNEAELRDMYVVRDRRRVLPSPARMFLTFLETHPAAHTP